MSEGNGQGWQDNLIEDWPAMAELLRQTHRVAVLGIKTEKQAGQPAFYVPEYLQRVGFEVIPVPVYYPELTEILGQPVYRRVADIPGAVDMVVVFRRPHDVPPHLDDLLEAAPASVWMQQGIRHDATARALAEAGVKVVQDRCIMVEHGRLR